MVWGRLDDGYATEAKFYDIGAQVADVPAWRKLSVAHRAALIRGFHSALIAQCSKGTSNGFIPYGLAETLITAEGIQALCRAPHGTGTAMLHTQESAKDCPCLAGRDFPPGYLLLHRFLRRNPSSEDVQLRQQKKAELDDEQLRLAVFTRWRWHCAYCGIWLNTKGMARNSPHYANVDHLNPKLAIGLSNLVACCAPCNKIKKDRTCEVASMWPASAAEHGEAIAHGGSRPCLCGRSRCPGRPTDHPANQVTDHDAYQETHHDLSPDLRADLDDGRIPGQRDSATGEPARSTTDQLATTDALYPGQGRAHAVPAGYDPGYPQPGERAMHRPLPPRARAPQPDLTSLHRRVLHALTMGGAPSYQVAERVYPDPPDVGRARGEVEAAVRYLARHGLVTRVPQHAPLPDLWRLPGDPGGPDPP